MKQLSDEKPSDYDILRQTLIEIAKEHRYKKYAGYIYVPLEECPCAYVLLKDYKDFINEHLASHPLMQKNVRRFDELRKYLENIDEPEFPFLTKNRNILSFRNGILLLKDRSFIPYNDPIQMEPYMNEVARNHIDKEFVKSCDTPLFDSMLQYQFEAAVCTMLYFFIGRLFFRVREKDNYSVMPFLHGMGNTGKSTIINVIQAMYQMSEVTTISENSESVFGMQNKWNKEVMLIYDVGESFEKHLDQQMFQKMVSGEQITIANKGKDAFDVKWQVPMIMASNFFLNYKDSSGQISRRIAMFMFKHYITSPDVTLEERIIRDELPQIIWKSLNTYLDIVNEQGNKSFWSFCPQYFRDCQLEMRQELNYVTRFLTASPEENKNSSYKFYVRYKQNHITNLADIKKLFENYMRFNHRHVRCEWSADYTPFKQLGYDVLQSHMCKSCNKEAMKGCCENYHASNRVKKYIVKHLEVVKERIPTNDDFDDYD